MVILLYMWARARSVSRCLGRLLVGALVLLAGVVPAAVAVTMSSESYTPVPKVDELSADALPDPNDALPLAIARDRAEKERQERVDRRGKAEEKRARKESMSRFKGRGRGEALGVARRGHRRLMELPVWAPPTLAEGESIDGYVGDHLMRIRREGRSVGAAVYSPFPLRAVDENGIRRPTDLALEERGDGFVTGNAPIDVRLPKRLADGVALGETGVSLRPPVTETASEGVEENGKVFWSDVATDTDFMVAPLPTGVETFHFLRSADAPEELPLMLDLPADATLRYAQPPSLRFGPKLPDGHSGIEVLRAGQVVATIAPPQTFDADGEPVDSSLRIGDGRVTLEVAHRQADVKYPLAADPVFAGYVRDDNVWRDGYPGFAGWQYSSQPAGYFSPLAGDGHWGKGLYVGAAPNAPYCCGYWGQWIYYAPGTSYVYRADSRVRQLGACLGRS